MGYAAYLFNKMVVLMEEVGEAAKDVNDKKFLNEGFEEEFVQVAAVALAIVEGILEKMSNVPRYNSGAGDR